MSEKMARVLHPNDLFALRYVHDAQFSRDGRRVAYVVSRTVEETADEFLEILIEDLASGHRSRIDFPGRVTFPRWSPDGDYLIFIGADGFSRRLYLTDASGLNTRALTAEDRQVQGPPSWSPDGRLAAYTVVSHRKSEGVCRITKRIFRSEGLGVIHDRTLELYLVDIRSGCVQAVEIGKKVAQQPSFSPCGKYILFLASDAAAGYTSFGLSGLKLYTVCLADGLVVEVLGDHWAISAVAWSPCGQRVVVAGDYDSQSTVPTAGLWIVNVDGTNPECRTEGFVASLGLRIHHDMPTWDTSQNNVFVISDPGHAYATVMRRGCAEIWRIALKGPRCCEPVVSGPRSCLVMDACAKTSQLLYCASDLHRPWDLYLFEPETGREQQLTKLNDDVLEKWPVLSVKHLEFKSSDGLPLEGWYLSRATSQGAAPTVMFIHGGPYIATGHVFRFDFHLLAANGYGVLFANFRGSQSYGERFARAIMGDWGGRGYPDHMATVDAAIAAGLADPERLGVWGPSHGGFATAWIVGHTPRFRAAIVESASTNWLTKYYLSDAPDWIVKELGGKPEDVPDVYRSRSPLSYASRCRTPTLLLHGEEDLRCPIAEAEQFYRALHDAGCATELVRIPGMDHMGDSTGPLVARRAQNEALLDWFERYLSAV